MFEPQISISACEREYILSIIDMSSLSDKEIFKTLDLLSAGQIISDDHVAMYYRYPFLLKCSQVHPNITNEKIRKIILDALSSRLPSYDISAIKNSIAKVDNAIIDGELQKLEEFCKLVEHLANIPSFSPTDVNRLNEAQIRVEFQRLEPTEQQKSYENISRFVETVAQVLDHEERISLCRQLEVFALSRTVFNPHFPLQLFCRAFKQHYHSRNWQEDTNNLHWERYLNPVCGIPQLILLARYQNILQQLKIEDFAEVHSTSTPIEIEVRDSANQAPALRTSSVETVVTEVLTSNFPSCDPKIIAEIIFKLNQKSANETFYETLKRCTNNETERKILEAIAPVQQHLSRQITHNERIKDQASLDEMLYMLANKGASSNKSLQEQVALAYDLYWYTGGNASMVSIYHMLDKIDITYDSSRLVNTLIPFIEPLDYQVTRQFYSNYSENLILSMLQAVITTNSSAWYIKDILLEDCDRPKEKIKKLFTYFSEALIYEIAPYVIVTIIYTLLQFFAGFDVGVQVSKLYYDWRYKHITPSISIGFLVRNGSSRIYDILWYAMCILMPINYCYVLNFGLKACMAQTTLYENICHGMFCVTILGFIYLSWFSSLYTLPVNELLKETAYSMSRWYQNGRFLYLEAYIVQTFNSKLVRTFSDRAITNIFAAMLYLPHLPIFYRHIRYRSPISVSSACLHTGYTGYVQPFIQDMHNRVSTNCSKLWHKAGSSLWSVNLV